MDNAGKWLISAGIGAAGLVLGSLILKVGFDLVKFQPSQVEVLSIIAISLVANGLSNKK